MHCKALCRWDNWKEWRERCGRTALREGVSAWLVMGGCCQSWALQNLFILPWWVLPAGKRACCWLAFTCIQLHGWNIINFPAIQLWIPSNPNMLFVENCQTFNKHVIDIKKSNALCSFRWYFCLLLWHFFSLSFYVHTYITHSGFHQIAGDKSFLCFVLSGLGAFDTVCLNMSPESFLCYTWPITLKTGLSPPHKVTLLVLKHSNVRLDKLLRLSDQQAIYSRFIKKDYSNIAFEVRLCRQSSHLTVRWYSIKYQASLITLCPYPSAVQMNSNLLLPGPMQPRLPLHHGQSDKGMREDIMCSSHKSCL